MTHLENYILESSDDEDSQEESYEDYILRKPNWILEKNDHKKYEVQDVYIRGLFESLNTPVETAKQENIQWRKTNRIPMIKPYWDSRREHHPINPKKKEFWKRWIELSPESRMTKGNAYDQTPLPDLLENAFDPQRRHDHHLWPVPDQWIGLDA